MDSLGFRIALFFTFWYCILPAQRIVYSSNTLENFKLKDSFNTKAEMLQSADSLVQDFHNLGYASASVDSLSSDSSIAFIYIGNHFDLLAQTSHPLPRRLSAKLEGDDGSSKSIEKNTESILSFYQNNGFPFAQITPEISGVTSTELQVSFSIVPGPIMPVDSLILPEKAKVKPYIISRFTGIKVGEPYNESLIKTANRSLQQSGMFSLTANPTASFTFDGAQVYLPVKTQKSSRFDGIVGLQTDEETGDVTFTGNINLKLSNALNAAETFSLNWEGFQDNSQVLKAKAKVPFLFRTAFGIGGQIDIFRADTAFNNVDRALFIPYFLQSKGEFQIQVRWFNSTNFDTEEEVATTFYGLNYSLNKLNRSNAPSRGFSLSLSAEGGEKKTSIGSDEAIESSQADLNLIFHQFVQISKNHVLLGKFQGASLFNDYLIFSELKRIGGLTTLRGFDQESIYASSFAIATLQYQFFFEEESFISLFFDQAWMEQKLIDSYTRDTPFGFGAGLNMSTNAGTFSIAYATGAQKNEGISFSTAKVHFGFVNYF